VEVVACRLVETLAGPTARRRHAGVELVEVPAGQPADVSFPYGVRPDPLHPAPVLQQRLRRPAAHLLVAQILVKQVRQGVPAGYGSTGLDVRQRLRGFGFDRLG
jgi:hypothetical protein